jgi:hypothetical protein
VHSFYSNGPASGKYVCRYRDCHAAFDKEEDKRLHCKKAHQDDSTAILVCDICRDVFPSQNLLTLHRRTVHASAPAPARRKRRKWDRKSLLLTVENAAGAGAIPLKTEDVTSVTSNSQLTESGTSGIRCVGFVNFCST